MGDRRPTRRAAGRSRSALIADQKQPDATHYIGYVEEGESVEMIMRKFEVLEQMKQAKKEEQQQQQQQQQQDDEDQGQGSVDGEGGAAADAPAKRKAEALEPATESNDGSFLDDPELAAEFFKATSSFTVDMVTADNAEEAARWEILDGSAEFNVEDLAEYFSDYEQWDEESFWRTENRKHSKRRKVGGARPSRAGSSAATRAKQQLLTYEVLAGGYVVPVRRRRVVDPTQPTTSRIPYPVPHTWARIIAPLGEQPLVVAFNEGHNVGNEIPAATNGVALAENILEVDWTALVNERAPALQGVLLDPPWKMPVYDANGQETGDTVGYVTGEDLAKIPFDQLLRPHGYVFCWVEKPYVPACLEAIEQKGFYYVENLCCMQVTAGNQPACTPYPFVRTSKRTLLMLRRNGNARDSNLVTPGAAESAAEPDSDIVRPLELRHQRNPDVCFDFLREPRRGAKGAGRPENSHNEYLYYVIETLLPTARQYGSTKDNALNDAGTCKLLEIWHDRKEVDGEVLTRPGWLQISERE